MEAILISAFIGSVGALAGGAVLLLGRKVSESIVHVLVSFAAGALIGTALFELLPEALHHAEEREGEINVFIWTLFGILFFYLLDRAIHWFQLHQKIHKGTHGSISVPLVILGDSAHNLIDGIAMAITFLVNPALGITTTLAVIAHELPQEIGDFAVLLHEGISRKKVLLINLFSALLAVVGAGVTILIGERLEIFLPYALSLTAGFFLYIALVNILPEIHREEKVGYAFRESLFLILGVLVIWLAVTLIPHV
jgi:zinc and cadmium transporter